MHEGVGLIESENTDESRVRSQLEGQARAGNIYTGWFVDRHEALVYELARRGYNHNSPLDYEDELDIGDERTVCADESRGTLLVCTRGPDGGCRRRILERLEALGDFDYGELDPTAWRHPTKTTVMELPSDDDRRQAISPA